MRPLLGEARRLLSIAGPIVGLALAIVLFAILVPDRFLSLYNLKTVATQTVIVGLSAIGMTFVMASGGIDLSIGSVVALASVVVVTIAYGARCGVSGLIRSTCAPKTGSPCASTMRPVMTTRRLCAAV